MTRGWIRWNKLAQCYADHEDIIRMMCMALA